MMISFVTIKDMAQLRDVTSTPPAIPALRTNEVDLAFSDYYNLQIDELPLNFVYVSWSRILLVQSALNGSLPSDYI